MSRHTTGDPIIPIWHQPLYQAKVLAFPNAAPFAAASIERYGHCAFTQAEVLAGFALLVQETGGALSVPASLFSNQSQASRFLELAHAHGANASVIR